MAAPLVPGAIYGILFMILSLSLLLYPLLETMVIAIYLSFHWIMLILWNLFLLPFRFVYVWIYGSRL